MRSEEEACRAIDRYADTVRRICMVHLKNYSDALDEILSSQSIEDYLSGDALMSLTVAGDNETQYTEILTPSRPVLTAVRTSNVTPVIQRKCTRPMTPASPLASTVPI